LISAIVIVVFFSIYVASGLVAGGIVFKNVFDINPTVGTSITILVIVVYTFLGGFLAVSYTDSVQGVLMWGAVIGVPVVVVALGGFGSAASSVSAKNPDLLQLTGNVSLADGNWASAGTLG
jgi:sodium/proline symporter